jgi:hypothetical protein
MNAVMNRWLILAIVAGITAALIVVSNGPDAWNPSVHGWVQVLLGQFGNWLWR